MKKLLLLLFLLSNCICLYSQSISEQFRQDTDRVEQKATDVLEENHYSTAGMRLANELLEKEYDILLNKYYKLLYAKLDDDGKKALKEAQLNWIKFRDADQNLITELSRNTYEETGGGTMWGVIYGDLRVQITRERVIVLYQYLVADNLEEE